ncbi:DUF317 domain-containing protein [Streptomyces ziwulingensis]
MSRRQRAEYEKTHLWRVPYDTSPRYLAGPGDARHVTHGLAATGWTRTSDPLNPHMVLTSPDLTRRLEFTPEPGHLSSWWKLTSLPTDTDPYWWIDLGQLVPVEILGSLTDALLGAPPAGQPDPWQSVPSAGWSREAENKVLSADGMCTIELRNRRYLPAPDDAPAWHIETHENSFDGHPGRRIWHASFHENTPAHLVNAFVAALTDTTPLVRGMYDSAAHHTAAKTQSRLTSERVVAAHNTRLDALRAQARTVRRQQRPTTTQPPAPPEAPAPARC